MLGGVATRLQRSDRGFARGFSFAKSNVIEFVYPKNDAVALAQLSVGSKSWFGRRDAASSPDLEYRTCATSSKADAKAAAERMIGRRETYMSGAA